MKPALYTLAFLIDLTTSFFIYQIVSGLIAYFWFIPFFPGFFIIWLAYYIVCYIVWKRSLGQAIIKHKISDSGNKKTQAIRIIFRESFTSLPAIILWGVGAGRISLISILIVLFCCVLTCFRKKIFRISITKDYNPEYSFKSIIYTYLFLILTSASVRIINTIATCDKAVAETEPLSAVPRPSVNSVKKYTEFLNDHRQDINDYVIGLFDKYDHLVICERFHPEMTQYDMIYNLVTDQRFVEKVGNVFTEIGCEESRDAYRSFVDKEFPNDSTVEINLASFLTENQAVHLLWPNTNWFEFLKKMYYFNHNHDKKVNILFADRNWIDRSELDFRDSIMADNIINTINSDSIKKSLIIMNYRHAYLTPGNCGYYVERSFPGRVANVMINTSGISTPMFLFGSGKELPVPIQHGKWDVAFEQINDDDYAFDFAGSPFGDDRFDHYLLPWSSVNSKRYKDMFTGFIYYKHPDDHFESVGYPHILDPENEKKLRIRESAMDGYSLDYWIEYLNGGTRLQNGIEIYHESDLMENKIYFCILAFAIILLGISIIILKRH